MIFSDGVIYSGLPNAKLIALEAATGLLIWEATISRPKGTSDIDKLNDITSQPVIDNSLIFVVSRGLDYYNRTVFEYVTDDLGSQGTVAGGGRFDYLVEKLGGDKIPACGFALGLS